LRQSSLAHASATLGGSSPSTMAPRMGNRQRLEPPGHVARAHRAPPSAPSERTALSIREDMVSVKPPLHPTLYFGAPRPPLPPNQQYSSASARALTRSDSMPAEGNAPHRAAPQPFRSSLAKSESAFFLTHHHPLQLSPQLECLASQQTRERPLGSVSRLEGAIEQTDEDARRTIDSKPPAPRPAPFPNSRSVATLPQRISPVYSSRQVGVEMHQLGHVENSPWHQYETRSFNAPTFSHQLLGASATSSGSLPMRRRPSTAGGIATQTLSADDPRRRATLSRPQSTAALLTTAGGPPSPPYRSAPVRKRAGALAGGGVIPVH
jgi:hypothetical protein